MCRTRFDIPSPLHGKKHGSNRSRVDTTSFFGCAAFTPPAGPVVLVINSSVSTCNCDVLRPGRARKKRAEKSNAYQVLQYPRCDPRGPSLSLPSMFVLDLFVDTQQVVDRPSRGGMPAAAPCRTGGAASGWPGPAKALRRQPSQEQVEFLTKALLAVAGHLKS